MPALLYPAGLAACLAAGGQWCWWLVAFNIFLVPIADHATRALAPGWQPSERLLRRLFAPSAFWLYAAAQAAVLCLVLLEISREPQTGWRTFGLVSATGIMTGAGGITAAHELIHRADARQRALGCCLLAMATYMHFRIEHVWGHHRRIGTPADPGTARLGESFPAYFARALFRGLQSAWRTESARLRAAGVQPLSPRNRLLACAAVQAALYLAIGGLFGGRAAVFFLAQSLMAIHLLEAVNYVQHYGLTRRVRGDGRPLPVRPQDAWESDYPLAGLLLFNLPCHAQHHLNAAVPCHGLRVSRASPKLPCSFFLMVFLALIPPLWRLLMDGRVRALRGERREPVVLRSTLGAGRHF